MTAVQIQEFDDPTYDPFEADAANFGEVLDPYPVLHELRAKGPVHEGAYTELFGMPAMHSEGQKNFMIVGAKEIHEVLTDTKRFSNAAYKKNLGATFGMGSISTMDPPEHGLYRKIFQKIFLPQNVKPWGESIVDPVVEKLMAKFLPKGKADLIEEFTLLYPFEVIYPQLNLPEEHIKSFQRLALGQTDYIHFDKALEAGQKLGAYFTELIKERRENPGDDLVTLLATTEVDGDYLPELVLVSFFRQLMNAAGDTTYRGTSILLTQLLRHPDQFDAIRKDRDLIPQAIEEALRWDGPVLDQTRMAKVDVELGGVSIPAGSILDVLAGAANRDPEIFENPDKFDIFRPRKPHYTFSRGPHICVGQHLARVEMTRATYAILDNLPDLRLDPDMPPPEIKGVMMRVPKHLYVRFGD